MTLARRIVVCLACWFVAAPVGCRFDRAGVGPTQGADLPAQTPDGPVSDREALDQRPPETAHDLPWDQQPPPDQTPDQHLVDQTPVSDGGCPLVCINACAQGVCELDCSTGCTCPAGWDCVTTCNATCSSDINCTQAKSCQITCDAGGCSGPINCGASDCTVSCTGNACTSPISCSGPCTILCDKSCNSPVTCSGGPCKITCQAGGCASPVNCQSACACDVWCSATSCPSGVTCPPGCTGSGDQKCVTTPASSCKNC